MIEVTKINNSGKRIVVATLATFAAAKAHVATMGDVVCMEDDPDYADCADVFLTTGDVMAIQPVGFRVTSANIATKAKAMAAERADAWAAFDAEFLTA